MRGSELSVAQPIAGVPAKNTSRHGTLLAVSMMKDEGPYLLEWVAHHMAVGFTDLLVYTNDCSDGTDDMLIRLEQLGLAHHRRNIIAKGQKPQPSAIRHATDDPLVCSADWVLVFDADEFLCLRHGDGTLDLMLDDIVARGANGMVITWRIFGSGGGIDWSRAPVSEQYLMAAPPMWNKGWGVKTLFKYDPAHWRLGIHRPKLLNKTLDTDFPATVKWLNGSGRAMEDYFKFRGWRSIARTIGYDWAQMNHYAVKSVDAYAIRKFRGNVNNKADKYNDDYWALQDRNEVRDDTMLRYSARRRDIFNGLLCDPVLHRLHHAALDRVEARLATLKVSPDYAGFVARLKAAGAVPISRVEAKPPKARDAAEIAALMGDVERRVSDKAPVTAAPVTAARARAAQPPDMVVRGAVDVSAAVPLDWHANHAVLLPADPRLFPPTALLALAEGKYLRNLARNLPALLPGAGCYVELGVTCGFVALHLARVRPDVQLHLQQGEVGWRAAFAWIAAQNAVPLSVQAEVPDLVALRPDVVSLADTAVDAPALERLLADHVPQVVVLTGALWCDRHDDLQRFETVLARHGFTERLTLDPMLAAGYCRAGQTP